MAMAKFAYRCMKCRMRNMFVRKLEAYKRVKSCKHCGHDRFYWDKARNYRTFVHQPICDCFAPYPHPHRKGSKWCDHNPLHEFWIRTELQGEDPNSVKLEMMFDGRWPGISEEEPPF
jgi:DNA-directed RNA polymerase subunit RPC12/RpoP